MGFQSRTQSAVFADNNYVMFTDLPAAEQKNVFPQFSIKYVFRGHEYYSLDSGEYRLDRHHVFYAVSQPGDVYFDNGPCGSAGLCIGFNQNILIEAIRLQSEGCFYADPEQTKDCFSGFPEFIEGLHEQRRLSASVLLANTCREVDEGADIMHVVDEEWFMRLASTIAHDEIIPFRAFKKLKGNSAARKKELIRRLYIGKDYMDVNFVQNPLVSDVARIAMLSEFHFYRSFKLAFGTSPHQYLLGKRLELAKTLLSTFDRSVGEVAEAVNFPNQFSFARAFKQKFDQTPGQVRKVNFWKKKGLGNLPS
ncbi:MAG TPA: AraC family transcriptional regulator [Chitinophagaceae bacterium]